MVIVKPGPKNERIQGNLLLDHMAGAEIVLKGAGTHTANIGSTALGTMRSVEYTVQNLEEVAAMLLEDGEPKFEGEFIGTQTVKVA